MELSIIISTYNNAASLVRTLDSVVKQDADKKLWECVVVNNNSTDDTAERVATFAKQHSEVNIRLVDEPKQGLSHARNRGIVESKGQFLAFIDDDETINEGFVSAYIDLFRNHGAFVGSGTLKVCYDSARPKWMSHYTEKMIANPLDLGNEIITITRKAKDCLTYSLITVFPLLNLTAVTLNISSALLVQVIVGKAPEIKVTTFVDWL